jgi:uncharacterized protein (UPF0332 family)
VNENIAGLLRKARESQEAASLLQREGYFDFAVSRAYYAIFYAAEAILLLKGLSFSSHSAVTAAFGKEFSKTGLLPTHLHRYLIDAERMRNVGDYDVGSSLATTEASEVIRWAEEFIQAVEQFIRSNADAPAP